MKHLTLLAATTLIFPIFSAYGASDSPDRMASHVVIVTDRSDSIEKGDGAACNAVSTMVSDIYLQKGIFEKNAKLGYMKLKLHSSIGVTGTGEPAKNDSKKDSPVVDIASIEIDADKIVKAGMNGPEYVKKRKAKIASEMQTQVKSACLSKAPKAAMSPVYAGVKDAVGHLQNICAGDNIDCFLIIQSDLVENRQPEIKKAVDRIIKGEKASAIGAIASNRIDLGKNISVFVCGDGQGSDVQDETKRQEIVALWQNQIFMNARNFVHQSRCPGYQPD